MRENILKFLKLVCLIVLFSGFSVSFAEASNDLTLEKITNCNIQYMGDTCVVAMKATNDAGEILTGEAIFKVEYEGELFDGEGIYSRFLPDSPTGNWLDSSGWQNGEVSFSGFDISQGETSMKLEIKTHSALIPGQYNFTFKLTGTTEDGDEQSAIIPVGGGGGGNGPPLSSDLHIREETMATTNIGETSVVISWDTTHKATSRVVYDTVPGLFDFNNPPNYGYSFSTFEFDTPANTNGAGFHSIAIGGLLPNTIYYYRVISSASPEKISNEYSFTTLVLGEVLGEGNRSVTQSRSGEVTNESDGGLVLGDVAENEPQEILDEDTGDNVTAPVVAPIAEKNEPPRGLTAALGMAWGEITGSFLWSVLVILCLMILAFFTRRKLLKSREK